MRQYPEGIPGCLVRLTSSDLLEAVRVAGEHRDDARFRSTSTLTYHDGVGHIVESRKELTLRCLHWLLAPFTPAHGAFQSTRTSDPA